MSENGRVRDEQDPRSYTSSAAGGFRPGYLVLGLAFAGALGVVFWLAASGRMP